MAEAAAGEVIGLNFDGELRRQRTEGALRSRFHRLDPASTPAGLAVAEGTSLMRKPSIAKPRSTSCQVTGAETAARGCERTE